MSSIQPVGLQFCGVPVSEQQLSLIQSTVHSYRRLSRTELAATLCELLGWLRPNGKPKTVECRQFLEQLADRRLLELPETRAGRPKGSTTRIETSGAAPAPVTGSVRQIGPIRLEPVSGAEARAQWRSLVHSYHYLGHRTPFGAHLRYLIHGAADLLGCLQFSSPAWRLRARDQWIGWDEGQRRARLQHIVCNSRFLILPWVRVPHLASHALARAARALVADWSQHYGVTPWLLETLVDPARYRGTCYRAANWLELGVTSGRGRDDRAHQRHGAAPKQLWVYPLCPEARDRLRQGG
jgi:hypothetical protein